MSIEPIGIDPIDPFGIEFIFIEFAANPPHAMIPDMLSAAAA